MISVRTLSLRGAAVGLLLLSAIPAEGSDRPPVIIHTNDILGEIEPCGCRTNPTGGMARKERLLKTHDLLQGRGRDQILQVDAGDLFFSTQEIPETLKKQSRIQALALAKALKITGLRAFVPGEKDFALGAEFIETLARESGADILAANLEKKTKSGWKKWLKPQRIYELSSSSGARHRVAVIGIIGRQVILPSGLRASDPKELIRKWVSENRKKAEWLVALTHQGLEDDVKLAEAVPGIDFIIGAHSQSYLEQPRVVEHGKHRTSIHQGSFRNQVVGLIELKPRPESTLIPLDASLEPAADPKSALSEIQQLVSETKAAIAQANQEEERKILARVQAAEKEGTPKFQTFNKCSECHFKQFDFWRKTPHAKAYEVLVKAGQHQNLECLGCHTVGLNDPQGFSQLHQLVEWSKENEKSAPALESWLSELRSNSRSEARNQLRKVSRIHATVQCENCHGPGRDHPFGLEPLPRVIATQSCLKCHTPERAPGWYQAVEGKSQLDETKLAEKMRKMARPLGDDVGR